MFDSFVLSNVKISKRFYFKKQNLMRLVFHSLNALTLQDELNGIYNYLKLIRSGFKFA